MNHNTLPRTTIVGRIANRPRMVTSRSGTPYALLLMYVADDRSARLLPVLSFGRNARRILSGIEQGNLIALHTRIDAIANGRYLNPSLIATSYSLLETERTRDAERRELTKFFPFVPENYRSSRRRYRKRRYNYPQSRGERSLAGTEKPKSSSRSEASSSSASPSTSNGTASNWLSEVRDFTSFSFPAMK